MKIHVLLFIAISLFCMNCDDGANYKFIPEKSMAETTDADSTGAQSSDDSNEQGETFAATSEEIDDKYITKTIEQEQFKPSSYDNKNDFCEKKNGYFEGLFAFEVDKNGGASIIENSDSHISISYPECVYEFDLGAIVYNPSTLDSMDWAIYGVQQFPVTPEGYITAIHGLNYILNSEMPSGTSYYEFSDHFNIINSENETMYYSKSGFLKAEISEKNNGFTVSLLFYGLMN